jgi:hypothetical protein
VARADFLDGQAPAQGAYPPLGLKNFPLTRPRSQKSAFGYLREELESCYKEDSWK